MEFRSDDARMRTRCDGIEQGCQPLVIKRLVARLQKLFSFFFFSFVVVVVVVVAGVVYL